MRRAEQSNDAKGESFSLHFTFYFSPRFAFTLAEVLITLAIIGVVAAITIPALINYTNYLEYKSSFKENYSAFSQALQSIISDNGGSLKTTSALSTTDVKNLFKPYMKITKECDAGGSEGVCWHKDGTEKWLLGTVLPEDYDYFGYTRNYAGLVLNNGTIAVFTQNSPDCSVYEKKICFDIHFDTNGFKGPNTIGKDIFQISATENKLIPFNSSSCGSSDMIDSRCSFTTPNSLNGGCCALNYLMN